MTLGTTVDTTHLEREPRVSQGAAPIPPWAKCGMSHASLPLTQPRSPLTPQPKVATPTPCPRLYPGQLCNSLKNRPLSVMVRNLAAVLQKAKVAVTLCSFRGPWRTELLTRVVEGRPFWPRRHFAPLSTGSAGREAGRGWDLAVSLALTNQKGACLGSVSLQVHLRACKCCAAHHVIISRLGAGRGEAGVEERSSSETEGWRVFSLKRTSVILKRVSVRKTKTAALNG